LKTICRHRRYGETVWLCYQLTHEEEKTTRPRQAGAPLDDSVVTAGACRVLDERSVAESQPGLQEKPAMSKLPSGAKEENNTASLPRQLQLWRGAGGSAQISVLRAGP